MKKTVSATEARVHLGEILRRVKEDNATYVVERNGEVQAVVISEQEYQNLQQRDVSRKARQGFERARTEIQAEIDQERMKALGDIGDLIRKGRDDEGSQFAEDLLRRQPAGASTD